jgi:4-hydroxy-tetrahydrodipicolinate synthase
VIGCTSLTAAEAVELGRHAIAAGADGIGSTPPPYSKTYPDETVRYFEDISDGVGAPVMIYNWPHGTSVDIGPDLAERLAEVENVVAIKDSTPDLAQFFETAKRVVGKVRIFGPFMSVAGLEFLLEHGGDGFIGGGSLWGAADVEFWEAVWRGDVETAREHARRTDELFPKLWLPGGWGGQFGAYQSQLKALMKLLGQPGGEVRPPRLPVTDGASLRRMEEILVEAGLLGRPVEAA